MLIRQSNEYDQILMQRYVKTKYIHNFNSIYMFNLQNLW